MQLTLRQVASLFAVTENTITRWVKEENLPVHEVRSQYRFDRAELLEWAATTQRAISPSVFEEINGDHVSEISLADAVQHGGVALRLPGADRYEVFHAAIEGLPLPANFDRAMLLDLLMAREKSGGAAIGDGIAIPHPRYPVVLPDGKAAVRTCYLDTALDFHASDGEFVHTLFLMVCPTVHHHLQLLARLSSVLKSKDFRKLLASRPDATRLVAAIRAEELTHSENVEAPGA